MNCPIDQAELSPQRYEADISVDECSQCHGVWLDRGELRAPEIFFERSRLPTPVIRRGFFASLLHLITG